MRTAFLLLAMSVVLGGGPAAAQNPADGAAVFQRSCASCHLQPASDSRAPARETLALVAPEAILTALTTGNMFRQGAELTDAERVCSS